jgi:GntR family transcriptional regulator
LSDLLQLKSQTGIAVIPTAHTPLRADQRPLYAQASEALKDLVQRNGYAAGDRLPSEIELSQRLGISRPTLPEALRHLEEDGVIVRRHGVGTFVAASEPVIEAGLEVLESIDRIAERHGLSTGMSEARVEERTAGPNEIEGLGLQSETPVTVVTRVIIADGERVAYLTDIVPQSTCGTPISIRTSTARCSTCCWHAAGRRCRTRGLS